MPYVTSGDLELAIGRTLLMQLADPDNTGRVDAAVVGEAIASSEAEINAYVAKRHAVPLALPVPELVRQLAIDGAVYRLKSRGKSMATIEEIDAAKLRTQTLRDIATGIITLGVDPGPAPSSLVVDKAGPTISAKLNARNARRGSW